jgi:hypothetical protein
MLRLLLLLLLLPLQQQQSLAVTEDLDGMLQEHQALQHQKIHFLPRQNPAKRREEPWRP